MSYEVPRRCSEVVTAWYGPIVMNTQAALQTAMRELQSGKLINHA